MKSPTFAASVVCMDPCNLERDIRTLEDLGVRHLHIDVMDGIAVPRYGIYPEIVKRISEFSNMSMDIHFMVKNVRLAITEFSNIKNVHAMSFHVDTVAHDAASLCDAISSTGAAPGIVYNQGSSLESAYRLLRGGFASYVLFMGIHPGVLVQTARPDHLAETLKEFTTECENRMIALPKIQVDGAVTFDSLRMLRACGATDFVGGSGTIYHKSGTVQENWQKIKSYLNL